MQNSSNSNRAKVIMVGMPDMANVCLVKLVQTGFNIVGFVPSRSDNPSYQHMVQCANALNVPVFNFDKTPNEKGLIKQIAKLEADIGLICSYDIKLSGEFLKTTKMGYINCHPSLLPKYRGANPYHHIIRSGETKTGVTLHFADENFDTGDIVLQKEMTIEPKETMGTLFNRSTFVIADSLIEILKQYEQTGEIQSYKQIEGEFVTAPKIPTNVIIDLNQDIYEIERLIRASNPFYSAILFFRGTMFRIISANIWAQEHSHQFGEIVIKAGKPTIAVRGGFIIPEIIQIGTWGIFSPNDFMEKFNPQAGERLTNG